MAKHVQKPPVTLAKYVRKATDREGTTCSFAVDIVKYAKWKTAAVTGTMAKHVQKPREAELDSESGPPKILLLVLAKLLHWLLENENAFP